jgi:hypothetical protein
VRKKDKEDGKKRKEEKVELTEEEVGVMEHPQMRTTRPRQRIGLERGCEFGGSALNGEKKGRRRRQTDDGVVK